MTHTSTPARQILSPTTLNRLVRDLLEDALPSIWVEGELSNLARPASGHVYFTLKDAGAQIRCAMFKSKSRNVRFAASNGMQVLVRGRIGLYEPRGDYQLIVEHMEEAGEGALRRQYEELKARLAAEGLFDTGHKRKLPRFPRRVGVLSSPSGAAVHDVLSVMRRRFPMIEVELLPVPVQGKEAAPAIIAMLQAAQRATRHDVLLLTRGGGSLEDLWAFNDETLVRTIAACTMPIVAAIGHEVDFTLAEFAADLRAPTPSAAAELLVPDQNELAQQLAAAGHRMNTRWQRQQQALAQRLDHLHARLQTQRPQLRLERGRERLAALHQRLLRARPLPRLHERLATLRLQLDAWQPQRQLAQRQQQCQQLRARLLASETRVIERRRAQVQTLARGLHTVSPLATLQRGYAILFDANGNTVRSVASIAADATVTARLADGSVCLRRVET